MNSDSFKNAIYKLCIYKSYVICIKRIWYKITYNG